MRAVLSAIAIIAGVGATSSALAQMPCSPRDDVLSKLKRSHSEAPVGVGVSHDGTVVEVLSTKEGETWTIIMTMPNGTSCLVAAGEAWENLAVEDGLGELASLKGDTAGERQAAILR